MGTDVRKLALDGYPGQNIIACDLRDDYIKIGFKLFGDITTCPITFIKGDIFSVSSSPPEASAASISSLRNIQDLSQLKGRLTHIYAGALFHLFNEETQFAIAVRLATLVKRAPGSIIFGRHQGREEAGVIDDDMGRYEFSWVGIL